MAKKKSNNFDKLVLNENIYIYQKLSTAFYPKRTIDGLFRVIKNEKDNQGCTKLDSEINKDGVSENGKPYKFSGLVLKYITKAQFVSEYIKNWEEQKLAYFFLIDFGNYIIITKKNVSGLNDFIHSLEPLPYELITTFLYNSQTLLEKFSMDNLESSSTAMKARSVESDSLLESFNYVGANSYMLNFLRVNNDNDRYTISANTSRLAKSGEKTIIVKFIDWAAHMINLAENFQRKETPLDVFARPYDYSKERDNLTPIALTILFSRILDDLDKGIITDVRYQYKDYPVRPLTLTKRLKGVSQLLSLEPDSEPYSYRVDGADKSLFKDLRIRMNEKSIRVSSFRLKNIKIYRIDDTNATLVDYINNRNTFFVNFNESEFSYANRKLFKNSMLLGSIDQFLTVFIPDALINQVNTEKGAVTATSTGFEQDTSFHYAEKRFADSDFLVLDDLGEEWADHIRIKGSEIGFILSKADTSTFSATAFTEIIGQAQKNMGSLNAMDSQINRKKDGWKKAYSKDNVVTKIPRLRKGASIDDFADRFIKLKTEPNSRKAIYLNINFISKTLLTNHLSKLKNNIDFPERKQAIQILWQISSLIASGREHDAGIYILCKP
ncbi:MAG: hypothetical protein JWP94_1157 [Mucilaginibacter sp.]|nr:hypothetical protein [Mucilaginibacter sp.]